MISHREIGDIAEKIAQEYIEKKGYRILDTNWYYGHLELDIVATDGKQLIVIEVKSRTGIKYEHPVEAVTDVKIKRIIEATEGYILQKNLDCETRFDVVTIIFYEDSYELEYFKDAFYPTL